MSIREVNSFAADQACPPFLENQRADLLASDVTLVGTGRYVVFSYKAPKNECLIVKGIAPYAMERINVGAADESFRTILPRDGNGWFLFEPTVNDLAAFSVNADVNAARLAASALNNDRAQGRGIAEIFESPLSEASRQWHNPLLSILVPEQATFRVVFSILRFGSSSPMAGAGVYAVSATATKRVDYAGCVVVGQKMSSQAYSRVVAEAEKGKR